MKLAYIGVDLPPWYRVCTKTIFILKRSYGYGESRNAFAWTVQNAPLPVRAVKLPRPKGGGIGSRRETCVYWGGPNAKVPCMRQGNIYIERKLRVWRVRKCIFLGSPKTPHTCACRQNTPSEGRRYRAEKGNLRTLGWTYRHGTVFAPRQYLY